MQNKSISKSAIFILVATILVQCSRIDYGSEKIAPQETSKEIIRVTNENVAGPHILVDDDKINWYTPSYLRISNDGKHYTYFTYDIENEINNFNIIIKTIANDSLVLGKRIFGDIAGMNFSPNAKSLVFSAYNEGSFNIHIMDVATGKINMNVIHSNANQTCPVYSKDGNTIYYSIAGQSAKSINQIPSASKTGLKFKPKLLKNNIPKIIFKLQCRDFKEKKTKTYTDAYCPDIINDKSVIVCRNNKDKGLGELWKINFTDGIASPILKSYRVGYSTPSVSPDGKKIVFVGSTISKSTKTPLNLDIYVSNVEGGQLKQITYHPGHDLSPVWSKDMKWIYFISERGNDKRKYNIWKIRYKE